MSNYQMMDDRIKYFRPNGFLNVSDHWNFALDKAQGEWQILLCDDDALIPSALDIINIAINNNPFIKGVTWSHASYHHDSFRKGALDYKLGSGKCELNNNERIIKEIFNQGTVTGKLKRLSPNMPMSACHHELLTKIRILAGGNIFYPPEPMTSMSMLAMVSTKDTLSIDLPLTILGSSLDSATSSARLVGGGEQTVFEKTNGKMQFKYIPVGSAKVFPSHKAETILSLKYRLPDEFSKHALNYANYFSHCYIAIREIILAKQDAKNELNLFFGDLRKQQTAVKFRVFSFLALYWVTTALQLISGSVIKLINNAVRSIVGEAFFKIREDIVFEDIVEAGKFLNEKQFGGHV
jgi:hypothetical protein